MLLTAVIKRLEWQGWGVAVMIENVTDRCDKEIGVAGIGGSCNDRECY